MFEDLEIGVSPLRVAPDAVEPAKSFLILQVSRHFAHRQLGLQPPVIRESGRYARQGCFDLLLGEIQGWYSLTCHFSRLRGNLLDPVGIDTGQSASRGAPHFGCQSGPDQSSEIILFSLRRGRIRAAIRGAPAGAETGAIGRATAGQVCRQRKRGAAQARTNRPG